MLVSTFHYPSLAQYRLAWQNIDSLNRSLQVGRAICIRKFEGTLPSGKKIAAYLAVIKLKSKRLQIASVPAQEGRGLLLTSELSHLHQSLVAINGGYFTFRPDTAQQGRSSVSLLVHQGKLISPHLLPVFRKDSAGNSCALYPTRSAVGFTGRRVRFAWTFTDSAGTTWAYDKPNPFTTQPLQQNPPTLFFPTTPYQWQASEIMGGGPMLIWKGTVFITDKEEWFTQIAGTHPRTAVGLDRKGRLLLLVVDGRQSGYSEGVTFSELAAIFLGLKANYAINLDGGGSSTMVVKGKVINRPSDKNGERKVASILAVIRK
ncbi:MAG: phosphodiester glycosidase family protein [Cytophagales bacterium]|nr:phosphodiester glycosidase family protein [Bernardetiaceae bacterium]MDW8203447.1 phosphodiester glycosidase family protein [Cytophagales bacterium]